MQGTVANDTDMAEWERVVTEEIEEYLCSHTGKDIFFLFYHD